MITTCPVARASARRGAVRGPGCRRRSALCLRPSRLLHCLVRMYNARRSSTRPGASERDHRSGGDSDRRALRRCCQQLSDRQPAASRAPTPEVESMGAGNGRILTTHAGSLPRPDDLADMIWAQMDGQEVDDGGAATRGSTPPSPKWSRSSARPASTSISDGEMSKTGFSTYVNDRFSGFDGRSEFQADDVADFPQLAMRLFATPSMAHIVFSNCVGPVEADRQGGGPRRHRRASRRRLATPIRRPRSWARSAPARSRSTTPTSTTARTRPTSARSRMSLSYEYKAITDAGSEPADRLAGPGDGGALPVGRVRASVTGTTTCRWRSRRSTRRSAGSPPSRSASTSAGATTRARTTATCRSPRSSGKSSRPTPARSTSRAPTRDTRTNGACSRTSSCPTRSG